MQLHPISDREIFILEIDLIYTHMNNIKRICPVLHDGFVEAHTDTIHNTCLQNLTSINISNSVRT